MSVSTRLHKIVMAMEIKGKSLASVRFLKSNTKPLKPLETLQLPLPYNNAFTSLVRLPSREQTKKLKTSEQSS